MPGSCRRVHRTWASAVDGARRNRVRTPHWTLKTPALCLPGVSRSSSLHSKQPVKKRCKLQGGDHIAEKRESCHAHADGSYDSQPCSEQHHGMAAGAHADETVSPKCHHYLGSTGAMPGLGR